MSDVICERCGFRYGAEHTKEDGTYSCPLCEVTQLEAEIEAQGQMLDHYAELLTQYGYWEDVEAGDE